MSSFEVDKLVNVFFLEKSIIALVALRDGMDRKNLSLYRTGLTFQRTRDLRSWFVKPNIS